MGRYRRSGARGADRPPTYTKAKPAKAEKPKPVAPPQAEAAAPETTPRGRTRRDILRDLNGGASAVLYATIGVQGGMAIANSLAESYERRDLNDMSDDFQETVVEVKEDRRGGIAETFEHGEEKVPDGRTLIDYFTEEVMNPEFEGVSIDHIPPVVREQLTYFVAGLISQESKFDDNRVNPKSRARLRVQTFESVARDYGTSLAKLRDNPEEQVRFVRAHLVRSYDDLYRLASDELQKMEHQFFAGRAEQFQAAFLVPAILTSYNGGAGVVINVLKEHADTARGVYLGYDAFNAMMRKALKEEWKGVDEETRYFFRDVYVQRLLIDEEQKKRD